MSRHGRQFLVGVLTAILLAGCTSAPGPADSRTSGSGAALADNFPPSSGAALPKTQQTALMKVINAVVADNALTSSAGSAGWR